jgi:hypothetical protein
MLTTPGIRAVSFDFSMSFCNNVLTKNNFINVPLQAVGNIIISCICTAHEKFLSNPPDWQGVIVRGLRLLTKRDMHRFKSGLHRVQLVRRVAQEPLVRGSKPLRC